MAPSAHCVPAPCSAKSPTASAPSGGPSSTPTYAPSSRLLVAVRSVPSKQSALPSRVCPSRIQHSRSLSTYKKCIRGIFLALCHTTVILGSFALLMVGDPLKEVGNEFPGIAERNGVEDCPFCRASYRLWRSFGLRAGFAHGGVGSELSFPDLFGVVQGL